MMLAKQSDYGGTWIFPGADSYFSPKDPWNRELRRSMKCLAQAQAATKLTAPR